MPINLVTAAGHKPLNPANSFRAYADIYLLDSTGTRRSPTFQCLVDTGSDYTILPMAAAKSIGLVLTGPAISFRAAGGASYTLASHSSTNLVIEGYKVTRPVAFAASSAFTPVIGRLELVTAFQIGMDATDWYWD